MNTTTTVPAVGSSVISWSYDEPVTYGGPDARGMESMSFVIGSGRTGVVRCDPDRVAPADTPIPVKDPRVVAVKTGRPTDPETGKPLYWISGHWRLSLPGQRDTWHKTKREAVATGLRRLAILDWHKDEVEVRPVRQYGAETVWAPEEEATHYGIYVGKPGRFEWIEDRDARAGREDALAAAGHYAEQHGGMAVHYRDAA